MADEEDLGLEDLMAQAIESDVVDETLTTEDPPVEEDPVETPVESPEPAEPQEEPEPAASTAVRDALAAQGYQLDGFEDDEALISYISEGYERASKAPDQSALEQMQQELAYLRQQLETKPAEQPPKETETPAPKWAAPQLSPGAQRRMKNDRLGRTEDNQIGIYDSGADKYIRPVHAAAELDEIGAFIDWKADAQERIAVDPIGVLKEAGLLDVLKAELGLDKIPERVKSEVLAEQTAKEAARAEEYYWNQHRNEYMELDEKGAPKTQMVDGKPFPVFNARGKTYLEIAGALEGAGLPDHEIFQKALAATNKIHAAVEPPKPADKKKAFLEKARTSGKKNGHKPVNRVFPTLAEQAANEDDEPRTLADIMAQSLAIDE